MEITIKNMSFYAFHGWYQEERKSGNHFELDVTVKTDSGKYVPEHIDTTINYQSIYDLCKLEMENPRKLLETVVQSLAKRIKAEFDLADAVSVKLRKLVFNWVAMWITQS